MEKSKPAVWSPTAHRGATYAMLAIVAAALWWLPPAAARPARNQIQWAFEPGTRLVRWGALRVQQISQYVQGEAAQANAERQSAHHKGR